MKIKAIKFEVRDLTASEPEEYPDQEYDILAHCDDGTVRYSDQTFETRDAAEVALAGFEHQMPDDLDQWEAK